MLPAADAASNPLGRLPKLDRTPDSKLKKSQKPWVRQQKELVQQLRLVADNREVLVELKKRWRQRGSDDDPRALALLSEKLSRAQADFKRNQAKYEETRVRYASTKRPALED